MKWLAGLFGKKRHEYEVSLTVETVMQEEQPPPKNLIFETNVAGSNCIAKLHRDYQTVVKVEDPDDYHYDDRRWVDISYKGKNHGYAWPEGYWTHTADNLPEKADIERWLCEKLGLLAPVIEPGEIKTTNQQNLGNKFLVQGRTENILIEATVNPRGYIIPFSIQNFNGKFNTKNCSLEITERYGPLQKALVVWLKDVYSTINTEGLK